MHHWSFLVCNQVLLILVHVMIVEFQLRCWRIYISLVYLFFAPPCTWLLLERLSYSKRIFNSSRQKHSTILLTKLVIYLWWSEALSNILKLRWIAMIGLSLGLSLLQYVLVHNFIYTLSDSCSIAILGCLFSCVVCRCAWLLLN